MKKKTFTEETFDIAFQSKKREKYSFEYKKLNKRDKQIVKNLISFKIKGKKCLDIGPGTGRWLQFLKANKASYLASVDISSEALKRVEPFCDFLEKKDVENENLSFKNNSFDIIISFMVLEHIRDPQNYISEIIRVAKNDAIILMSIPNIVSFTSRIRVLLGRLPKAVSSDKTHVKYYTERELIKMFKQYNMKPSLLPTSIILNPFVSKPTFRISSNRFTKSLDDHLLFRIDVKK